MTLNQTNGNGRFRQAMLAFMRPFKRKGKLKDAYVFRNISLLLAYLYAAIRSETPDAAVEVHIAETFDTAFKGKIAPHRAVAKNEAERCAELDESIKRIKRERSDIRQFEAQPDGPVGLPKGWKLVTFSILVILITGDTAANVTLVVNYVVNQTNDYWIATISSFSIFIAPVVFKYVLSRLSGLPRKVVHWMVTSIGLLAFLTFVYAFANHYGSNVSDQGFLSEGASGGDSKLLLIAQLTMGLTFGVGLLYALVGSLNRSTNRAEDAGWTTLTGKLEQATEELEASRKRLTQAESEISVFHSARSEFVSRYLSVFRAIRKDKAKEQEYLSLLNMESQTE